MTSKTINLLSPTIQRALQLRRWHRSLLRFYFFTGAVLCVTALIVGGAWWFLNITESRLRREAEEIQMRFAGKEVTDIKKQVKVLNAQITDYNQLAVAAPRWSRVLERLAQVAPPGLQVTSFTVDSNKRVATITGFSPTRDLVISLYNNLVQDTEYFEAVNYPLENVAKPANINFSYTFTVKEQAIR